MISLKSRDEKIVKILISLKSRDEKVIKISESLKSISQKVIFIFSKSKIVVMKKSHYYIYVSNFFDEKVFEIILFSHDFLIKKFFYKTNNKILIFWKDINTIENPLFKNCLKIKIINIFLFQN